MKNAILRRTRARSRKFWGRVGESIAPPVKNAGEMKYEP